MVSPVAYLKQILKKILPAPWVAYILRTRGEKLNPLDLSVINIISNTPVTRLTNEHFMETELLPRLGFNNENLHEFPEELYPFCGKGLLHWQYPNQFSGYLVLLAKLKPASYLEIGVRHGGTFIITLEYLKKFTPVRNAVAIDLAYPPSIPDYKKINSAVSFYQMNSQLPVFGDLLMKEKHFDLVFIDGNHEEGACMNDFNKVKDYANMIALHDIASDACPGVKKIWFFIKTNFKNEYLFFEFTKQYESVTEKTRQSFFGIGLAVRKEIARNRDIL